MPEIKSQPQQTVIQMENAKSRRGFASMDKERHRLVSSKGGKTERRQIVNLNDSLKSSFEGF